MKCASYAILTSGYKYLLELFNIFLSLYHLKRIEKVWLKNRTKITFRHKTVSLAILCSWHVAIFNFKESSF